MLAVSALTRSFAGRRVLGPLSLDVAEGERVAIVGHNGAGKSTLLRCVAGSLTPTGGEVRMLGHVAGSRAARALTGVSFSQERSFYLRLTGHVNLLTFARLRYPTALARRAVAELVEELEIAPIAAQRVDRCSSGMIQQLSLARALLGEPRLVLLDEPTRSLDDQAAERLWAAFARRPHTALLIATHRHEDLSRCERTVELAQPAR